jgi:cytochrome oxidase Cu insertion factor (SCO1/SenC/PrrC family)
MYADSLLKNTSTKHNKYVVNHKLEHVDDISFRFLRKSDAQFVFILILFIYVTCIDLCTLESKTALISDNVRAI